MGASHANHPTCYGMQTHNDQQGIEAKTHGNFDSWHANFCKGTHLNSPLREQKLLNLMACHQQEF
jgi:hypothetical protein